VRLQVRLLGEERPVQRLALCIADEGVGIAPERLPLLFRPYLQADDSLAHRAGGTGLGLVLCKRLVEAMGGQIRVASEKGAGTRITVELALAVDQGSPVPAAEADGAATSPLRVLLADDDRVQQILLEAMLVQAGCAVDLADGGAAAQALWLQHRHRLVLTDLQMPGIDGPAFAGWLRAQPGGAEVQLVGTSADLYEGERALAAGIARVLPKPVSQPLVDEVVQQALRSAPAAARAAA
jgi:CheY-like chemotaxis protein